MIYADNQLLGSLCIDIAIIMPPLYYLASLKDEELPPPLGYIEGIKIRLRHTLLCISFNH